VIVSGASIAVAQILRTSSTAVVFAGITDPVSQGFVKSLARPDGNATGFAAYEVSLGGKWIETLKELSPGLRRAAVLYEPTTAPYMPGILRSIVASGPSFGVQVDDVQIHNIGELDSALASLAQQPNIGVIVPPASFTNTRSALLVTRAAKYRLPTIYAFRIYIAAGGLISKKKLISKTYLRNAWYVAAWSDDLVDGKLLARTIMKEPVVLYRKADGNVAAIQDRRPTARRIISLRPCGSMFRRRMRR
jgi:putative ABC transport system substrate-binding protein